MLSHNSRFEARKLVVSQREQALAVSRDMITVQEARVQQMSATIDRLQWRVEQAERNLNSTVLKSPFTGIVRSSTAEIGRAITANDVVVSMYEAESLEVHFHVDRPRNMAACRQAKPGLTGRDIELTWTVGGAEYKFPAAIDRIGAEITSNRGGVESSRGLMASQMASLCDPAHSWKCGCRMLCSKNTFTIPDTAIYGTNTVLHTRRWQVGFENTVTIAAFEGEQVLISSGLKLGDEVLTTRITEVSAGLNVRREGDPVEPSGPQGAVGRPSPEEIKKILA